MSPATSGVRTEAISMAFATAGGRRVLFEELNVCVPPGRVLRLRGPSGSGKTTALNVMAGLVPPDSGSVQVAGHSLSTMTEPQRARLRRRRVGIIYQQPHLIGHLSALDNAALSLTSGHDGRSRASAALAQLGIGQLADQPAATLSGGEQQRVAVARALVRQPSVILADEPTSSVDDETAATVLGLLAEQVRSGAALVFAAHHGPMMDVDDEVVMGP